MGVRRLVALVLPVYALSACSGAPPGGGATLPPVTPSGSFSASVSPSVAAPPSVPPEATPATTQGAEAFGRFFVLEVYEGYVRREPGRVSRLSDPSCVVCSRYVSSIQSIKDKNARIGSDYSVDVLDAVAPAVPAAAETADVTVIVRMGPFVVTDPAGKVLVSESAAPRLAQNLRLRRTGDSWKVAEVSNS